VNCRNVLHLLSAYMDGELRGVEHRLVHQHLSNCMECEAEYQDLLRTKRLLGRMALQQPRLELPDLILNQVEEEERRSIERQAGSWLNRLQGALRGTLPSPHSLLVGTGLGVALAFVLAYQVEAEPAEDRDIIVWDTPGRAHTALLHSDPALSNVVGGKETNENWLRYGEPLPISDSSKSSYATHPTYTPVGNMSPYAPVTWEEVDAQRGWHSRMD
jgi:anti-sigma factor RsiW